MCDTAVQNQKVMQNVEDQLDFAIEKQKDILKMIEQHI
jgi:hypothetical protein